MNFRNNFTLLKSVFIASFVCSQATTAQTLSPEAIDQEIKERKSSAKKLRWNAVKIGGAFTAAGPHQVTNGQVSNISGSSTVVGAVVSIATHPTDPDQMWITTVNGGIFKTDNATATSPSWTPQTDNLSSLSMGQIDIDGSDNDILVAGFANESAKRGLGGKRLGLIRTTDGGTNWNLVDDFPPFLPHSPTERIPLSVSGVVSEGNTIVVSTDKSAGTASSNYPDLGVFKSTDAGVNFTRISTPDYLMPGESGLPEGLNFNLAQNPNNSDELYVHVKNVSVSNTSGIYRSADLGSNWERVGASSAEMGSVNLYNLLNNVSHINAAISVGASGAVFVGVCNNNSLVGLFRSANQGVDWTQLDIPSSGMAEANAGLHPGNQCRRHFSLVAHPTDPNVVFIGGDRQPRETASWPNRIGAIQFTGRLFRVDASQASGSQVTPITNCPDGSEPNCGGLKRTDTNSAPHADSRFLAFDADDNLIDANDGGVYKKPSPDATGGSATDWISLNGDLSNAEHHDVVYDSISDIVISGNQDTGVTEQTSTGSTSWDTVGLGDGGDVAVAEGQPLATTSTRYSSAIHLGLLKKRTMTSTGSLDSEFDPPMDFDRTMLGCDGVNSPADFPFTTPIVINGNSINKHRVLISATNGLYYSPNEMNDYCRIKSSPVNYIGGGGSPMIFGIESNPEIIYVAQSGQVNYSTTWPPVFTTRTVDAGSDIIALAIDPSDANRAYAMTESKVYRTENMHNWTEITNNLDVLSDGGLFTSITFIEGTSGNGLVIGGRTGVFIAKENQNFMTWEVLGTGLPNAMVWDLHYDSADDVLTASTLGRGSFQLTGLSSEVPVELQSFEIE